MSTESFFTDNDQQLAVKAAQEIINEANNISRVRWVTHNLYNPIPAKQANGLRPMIPSLLSLACFLLAESVGIEENNQSLEKTGVLFLALSAFLLIVHATNPRRGQNTQE